ncbi:LysR family transcriptional regulator [Microvirga brassicacearum]|uniref:LysR family transcriptional regulator n=1 Tax=Microvirga brassicacearum TaxID=2580413 RepID=A0A5N3P432_9HYPH|nr:LysR family transcriptional regulator [Microvirga brassicacearum]KAB0264495.1 LysR family transcriptional regulator [Microvirga brassicacearum]
MAPSSLDPSLLAAASQPSWDDLRIFLAVVAHGSMNGAGRALGQSQPTIARRMRVLEDGLGVALFIRGPNNLSLTEAGRAVLEAAAPMASAADAVPAAAAAYGPDPAAPVRVTATASVTMFLSLHAGSLAKQGNADIAYIPTRRHLDLIGGEADIALRMRRLPELAPELVVRRVGRVAFAMYAQTASPTAVIAPSDDPTLSRQAAFVARFAEGRPIAARIGDMPIRYQAARSGLGAAFLPCWLGDSDPDLVQVAPPPQDLAEDVFLIMHERSRKRTNVQQVANAMVGLFKKKHGLLAGLEPRRTELLQI